MSNEGENLPRNARAPVSAICINGLTCSSERFSQDIVGQVSSRTEFLFIAMYKQINANSVVLVKVVAQGEPDIPHPARYINDQLNVALIMFASSPINVDGANSAASANTWTSP